MRAKDAIKYGREIGRTGNPPIFSEEEEQECYNYVRSILPENTYFSDEEFRQEVCSKEKEISMCLNFVQILKFWLSKRNGSPVKKIPTFGNTFLKKFRDKIFHQNEKTKSSRTCKHIFCDNIFLIDILGEKY